MAVAHGIGLTRDLDLNRPAEACSLVAAGHRILPYSQWHITSNEVTV